MLFFLSKGYFASGNCRKEIAATIRNKNPIILLHETDPARGGIPISQVYDESGVAGEGWRDQIFVPHRAVIPVRSARGLTDPQPSVRPSPCMLLAPSPHTHALHSLPARTSDSLRIACPPFDPA